MIDYPQEQEAYDQATAAAGPKPIHIGRRGEPHFDSVDDHRRRAWLDRFRAALPRRYEDDHHQRIWEDVLASRAWQGCATPRIRDPATLDRVAAILYPTWQIKRPGGLPCPPGLVNDR